MTDRRAPYLEHLDTRLVVTRVDDAQVDALVVADREPLRVRWTPAGGWRCTCPARTPTCGHVAAVRTVVLVDADGAA